MKKIAGYFLQGLLFVVPTVVTFYIVYMSVLWLDNLLPIKVPVPLPGFEGSKLPGLGILLIVAVISVLGYIGTRFVRNPFFVMFEAIIERTPLLKIIYSSVKDLIEAFVGEKKRFNQPVLVTINNNPVVQRIGFITENDLSDLGLPKNKMAVYLPFSYGFNGQLVIVESDNVFKLDASGTEMMKFIISGGVTEINDHPLSKP